MGSTGDADRLYSQVQSPSRLSSRLSLSWTNTLGTIFDGRSTARDTATRGSPMSDDGGSFFHAFPQATAQFEAAEQPDSYAPTTSLEDLSTLSFAVRSPLENTAIALGDGGDISPGADGGEREKRKASGSPEPASTSADVNKRPRLRAWREENACRKDYGWLDLPMAGPFACPFYRAEGIRHLDCARLKLNRIADVKQHLRRVHRQPLHCDICLEILPDGDALRDHRRAQNCTTREYVAPYGMTPSQEKMLASRSGKRVRSDEERWFEMWSILFPGQPAPKSPYLGDPLSEDMEGLRQFMAKQGTAMIAEQLQNGALLWGSGQELKEQLRTGLSYAIDEWLGKQTGVTKGRNGGQSSKPEQGVLKGGAPGHRADNGSTEGGIISTLDGNPAAENEASEHQGHDRNRCGVARAQRRRPQQRVPV